MSERDTKPDNASYSRPTHCEFFDGPQGMGVRVTWQCLSLDEAMAKIHQAARIYPNVDATYQRESNVLVLVLSN